MSSASGSKAYVAITKQVPATPRTIPNNPVMQKVNFVKDSLSAEPTTKTSNHVRDDRMITDVTVKGLEIGGGYEFEYQFENSLLDELLLGFLWQEDWSDIRSDGAVADIEAGTIATSGAVLDLTGATEKLDNIVDGQKVKITGTANSGANDGVYSLTETVANTYTMSPAPAATETLGAGVTAKGSMARNGSFYQPFFIERGHTDVLEYFKFLGMACNVMALNIADQSDVTGSFDFVGLTAVVEETVESGATYTAVTDTPVFSTVTNVPSIFLDDVIQESCFVKEMTLEINNNVTPKTGIGVYGACETNAHKFSASGKMTMYFEDSTMFQKLLNGTAFSVSWVFEDALGNGYVYTLPRVKLDSDKINVESGDDDVMDNASYVALADSTTACAVQIDKYSA